MIQPECLNPKEVLAHLNSLGYQDITPHQLKEFLHDLKKLIKYDQRQISQSDIERQTSKPHICDHDCSLTQTNADSEKSSDNDSSDGSLVSECPFSAAYGGYGELELNGMDKQCTRSGYDSERLQPSFIRPWQLAVSNNPSSKSKKNPDPVKLYHQYKELWNQCNIPGESRHLKLRWVIRNKMMGQEPQPRVLI